MPTVNSQIVDSVSDVVTLTTANAPAQAFGMLDTVMVETLGMAMYNAVNRQQGASMISSAAVTAACAKMINANLPAPEIKPPLPPEPPVVEPLRPPPPSPGDDFAQVASALAGAQSAIHTLKEEAVDPQSPASGLAACGLSQIATETRPTSDYGDVAAALAAAEAAIATLREAAKGSSAVSALAQSSLAQIEADAKPLTPPAPPPPPPAPVVEGESRVTVAETTTTVQSKTTGKKAP